MNSLDIICLSPIAIGFVYGLFKGLIKELASLVSIVLAIYGAKLLAPGFSSFLISSFAFKNSTALDFAYLVIFVGILIALFLLTRILEKVLESISLGGLNKFLGGVFGGLKWALVVSVLLTVFDSIDRRFTIIEPTTKTNSVVYHPLMNFGPTLWDKAKSKSSSEDEVNSEE